MRTAASRVGKFQLRDDRARRIGGSHRVSAHEALRTGANPLTLLMRVLAIGGNGLEKPYNVIPFHLFWGIVLGLGLSLSQRRLSLGSTADAVEVRTPREARDRFA